MTAGETFYEFIKLWFFEILQISPSRNRLTSDVLSGAIRRLEGRAIFLILGRFQRAQIVTKTGGGLYEKIIDRDRAGGYGPVWPK